MYFRNFSTTLRRESYSPNPKVANVIVANPTGEHVVEGVEEVQEESSCLRSNAR